MSKEGFIAGLCGIALIALFLVPGAFDAVFALVFIGMIPLTHYVIPPMIMLAVYALLIALGIRWIVVQPVFIPDTKRRDTAERTKARKRVMKKTKHHSVAKQTAKRRRYRQTVKA